MRLVWKSLDKMRCFRKRSTIPFLVVLITFLLFINLYMEDGYVLVRTLRCAVIGLGQLREGLPSSPLFKLWRASIFGCKKQNV